jgi:aspartyl-tRNA(Asn)/glutamyl-tRNA(Gln) amidotransferase subunit A
MPAACCGVVGFKPTFGLVPIDGCFPLAPSFDTAGPMARDVAACAAMMRVLAPELEQRERDSLEEVAVGVTWTAAATPLVRDRVEAAAARFPNARRLDVPEPDDRPAAVFMREVADVHRELFADNADLYGDDVGAKIERCLAITDAEYERDLRDRREYDERVAELIDGVDLLITPTLPFVAPRVDLSREETDAMTRFTYPFNRLGWPALAVPCGAAEDGAPASVQLAGRKGSDALVLAAGALLEDALSPN